MNIALFSGTFDPIHRGHVALAHAAKERFSLGRIYFAPTGNPPHKKQLVASFADRYAMVVLATMAEKAFVPSRLEEPGTAAANGKKNSPSFNYSLDTVRRLKATLKKADQLFFLVGIDAFDEIAKWHEPEALLRECPFIVGSRPGYSLADVANALPEKLRPKAAVTKPFARQPAHGDLVLPGVTVHLLEGVQHNVSATAIREAVSGKKSAGKLIDSAVAEYIRKIGLYRPRG